MLKKLLLGALALLLLFVGTAAWLGSREPAFHHARVRAQYAATPERVWSAVRDLDSWPSWNSVAERMEAHEPVEGLPAWTMHSRFGPLPMRVEELGELRMRTLTSEEDGVGFHGSWSYEVQAAPGGGSVLVLDERGSIESVWMRAAYVLFVDYDAGLRQFAADLGAHLGESIEPETLLSGEER